MEINQQGIKQLPDLNQKRLPEPLMASKKDFFLVSFIAVAFVIFSIPILKNIDLPFLNVSSATILFLIFLFLIFANIAIWLAAIIGRKLPAIFQIAKFAAVGAFNTFFDWGILNLLIALTGIASGVGFGVFKGFSFAIAVGASYFWNKYWTFKKKEDSSAKEVGAFLGVSAIGVIINITLASLVVFFIKPEGNLTPERIANIGAALATIISLVWNFIGYKFIVFKK